MGNKRILSVILAGVIAFTSIGANAITSFAVEKVAEESTIDGSVLDEPKTDEPEIDEPEIEEQEIDEPVTEDAAIDETQVAEPEEDLTNGTVLDVLAYGACGKNVSWELFGGENDLTLHFYGSGETYNDLYDCSRDGWYAYRSEITNVKVDYGITSIGASAFSGCTNLTAVDIADSVDFLWNDIFMECTSLETIEIPNSVVTIGSNCFWGCTSLKSITLPDSVDYIGCYSFYDCCALESLDIPDSVTRIEKYLCYNCTSLVSVDLPDGLREIGYNAFTCCYNLSRISIPDTVDFIEAEAFRGCNSITSLTIPEKVDRIYGKTFSGCDGLKTVTFKGTVKSIEDRAFCECSSLTDLDLPDSLTSIGYAAFGLCKNLTSVTIPDSVTRIDGYAFSGCDSIETLVIPASVTTLGDSIMSDSDGLKSIEIRGPVTGTGKGLCSRCTNLVSVKLPATIKIIGDYAFSECTSLKSVSIPDSVEILGEQAFKKCPALGSVKLPTSLKTIDFETFSECTSLKTIIIPQNVTSVGGYAFKDCTDLQEAIILGSITSVGSGTFKGCTSLTTVKIPSSVSSIGDYAFLQCSKLTDVYYEGSKEEFDVLKNKIGKDNDYLLNAPNYYFNWDSEIDSRPTYTIEATAVGHGKISPEGIITVHEHTGRTYTFTPDKGYQVAWYVINGERTVSDKKEYKFTDVTQDCTIEVGFELKHNYVDTVRFTLSNDDNTVEGTNNRFTFDFDDFFRPSYDHRYRESMLRMSMRVAMAAMDPNSYTGTEQAATYIKDLMDKLDFDYDENKDIDYMNPDGNTIGTAIGSRKIIKDEDEYTLVMVALRGGGYLNEWAGNANVGDALALKLTDNHYGFETAAKKVVENIGKHLDYHGINDLSKVKIWITGYSRAAAVSNLTAAFLDDGAISGLSPENIYAFCYECPKNTMKRNWDDSKYSNIINVVNLVDFIPLVAPCKSRSSWNYHRYGQTYYIDDGNHDVDGFPDALEKMKKEYKSILGTAYSIERLNRQLLCYITSDNLTRNQANRDFVGKVAKVADTPMVYMLLYQSKIYKEIMKAGDISNLTLTKFISSFFWILVEGKAIDAYSVWKALDEFYDYLNINHYPELALAWIDSMQMKDYLVGVDISSTELILNCPVDISVCDRSGKLVGQIINNEVVRIEGGIGTYIDENGQKAFIIPSGGDYRVEAKAYADGEVSLTSLTYSGEDVGADEVESYLQIEVKEGETVAAVVSGDTMVVTDTKGKVLTPDIAQSGEEVTDHNVEAMAEGPGTVEGGGSYYAGEFCQVTATADEDRFFQGWYDKDVLVTTEPVYRFAVLSDTVLTARFTEFSEGSFSVQFGENTSDPYDGLYYNPVADRYEAVYTGTQIRPSIVVKGCNVTLTEGQDYTVKYSNNTNYNSKGKPATVTVTGKGSFAGKKVLDFYILQADLNVAKQKGLLNVSEVIGVQTGKKISPVIVYRDYTLKAADMDLSNKAAIKSDTQVDISGKGNFKGRLEGIDVRALGALDVKNKTIKVALKAQTHTYNGKAQTLTCSTADVPGELTVTAGSSKIPLISGSDYLVTYKNNINAGTATVRIKAAGDYIGEISKTFKIQPDRTGAINAELADPDAIIAYTSSGAKPKVKVALSRVYGEEEILVEGRDYKVSYSNNKKKGEGRYTVSFIGNYKGHPSLSNRSFKISVAAFEGVVVKSPDMVYTKPGKYLSAPFVSVNGVQLSTKDYTVKYYDDGVELTAKSRLTLDATTSSKTIVVKVTGKGNYEAKEITASYSVSKADASRIDLSKAKIVAAQKNSKGKDVAVGKQEYSGRAVRPAIRVLVKSGSTWIEVQPQAYKVEYINNVNTGKATVLVTGDGINSVGSKKSGFIIGVRNIGLFKWLFG